MKITKTQAINFAKKMKIDFKKVKYDLADLLYGMNVELEHGYINKATNVTNNSITKTGKIALAHLNEHHNYYKELKKMEKRLGIE